MTKKKRYGKLEIKIITHFCDDFQRLYDLTIKNEENILLSYARRITITKQRKKKKRIPRDEALYNEIRKNHFFGYLEFCYAS